MKKTKLGLDKNVEAVLSYLLGFITGIFFYVVEENKFVKFHAMQSTLMSIVFTVVYYVLAAIIGWIPFIGALLLKLYNLIVIVIFIVFMINAYKGKKSKAPVIGEWAESIANK